MPLVIGYGPFRDTRLHGGVDLVRHSRRGGRCNFEIAVYYLSATSCMGDVVDIKEELVAIILRMVQQFEPSKKQEFHAMERLFAELERQGILPRGERLAPISGRDPGNTIIWQCRFDSLCAAEAALELIENSPEHTELANKQQPFFQQSWVEFYQVLDY